MLKLEYNVALMYKERTHRDDYNGWTPDTTPYRYLKRQMAKVSRRNAQVIIAEYSDTGPDLELHAQMQLWVAYLLWLEAYRFAAIFLEFLQPDCSGPGYCNICDGVE